MKNENATLHLCNLASKVGLANARKIIAGEAIESIKVADTPKKITAREKKKAIAADIEKLGGDPPEDTASVQKFEETLADVKSKTE